MAASMTYSPITDAWASYEYGRTCLRRALVAAGLDYWTTPVELYAAEAGPLWHPVIIVSGVAR